MAEILVQVGKRIRELRKARGLSQHALAEKCGFTFSYIGGVERAEKNISLINLSKITDALEVGVHQFFIYSHRYENPSSTVSRCTNRHKPKRVKGCGGCG